jgi:hypothetical protein
MMLTHTIDLGRDQKFRGLGLTARRLTWITCKNNRRRVLFLMTNCNSTVSKIRYFPSL